MSNRHPEIVVPDLTKPAGAQVDADGNVRCVTCGKTLPVGDADVVGLGYRCVACSARTSADDLNANLDVPDRARILPPINGRKFLVGGGVLLVVAVVMWIAQWDVAWGSRFRPQSLFIYVCVAAVGCIGIGLANLRNRR